MILYGASGCHLCERAREVLERVRRERPFTLTEVDIARDPELESRYRELIPAVQVGGRIAFTYHVHADALRRLLEAQSRLSSDRQ